MCEEALKIIYWIIEKAWYPCVSLMTGETVHTSVLKYKKSIRDTIEKNIGNG